MIYRCAFFFAVMFLITACSKDPKIASKENFQQVIQKHFDAASETCYYTLPKPWPFTFQSYSSKPDELSVAFLAKLQALVKAGLLVEKPLESKALITRISFDISDSGKKIYKERKADAGIFRY